MDWSSGLRDVKRDLDELRRQREDRNRKEEAERQKRIAEGTSLFQSLQIEAALREMNSLLLGGQGELEVYSPGDLEEEEVEEEAEDVAEDDEESEEETDSMFAILTWEEEGTREIAVDLGITPKGFYLEVNGAEVRLEQEAVHQALISAFKEEVGL